jgi:LAS superfamily LD-carboxypeptidase LdcB
LLAVDTSYHRKVSSQGAPFDERLLKTFPSTFKLLEEQGVLTPIITLDQLGSWLSADQRGIVEQIINLRPQDYGVHTPYAGDLEPVPADLVQVSGQQYVVQGEPKTLSDKYVPRHVYAAYVRMNDAFMADEPDRKLLIQSCYRSPAYQIIVFLNWLINAYNGDIAKTIRHASPPNYSQHTIASRAAMDFKTIDGSPSDDSPEDFKDTPEYAWLCLRGNEFGFYESWRERNEFCMRAEPWHWQYREQRRISLADRRSADLH